MAKWNGSNQTEYFSNVTVDTNDISSLLFHTPLDQSFTCPKWGSTNLETQLVYSTPTILPTKLSNSTVDSSTLQFDAFRSANLPTPGFRVWFLFLSIINFVHDFLFCPSMNSFVHHFQLRPHLPISSIIPLLSVVSNLSVFSNDVQFCPTTINFQFVNFLSTFYNSPQKS